MFNSLQLHVNDTSSNPYSHKHERLRQQSASCRGAICNGLTIQLAKRRSPKGKIHRRPANCLRVWVLFHPKPRLRVMRDWPTLVLHERFAIVRQTLAPLLCPNSRCVRAASELACHCVCNSTELLCFGRIQDQLYGHR